MPPRKKSAPPVAASATAPARKQPRTKIGTGRGGRAAGAAVAPVADEVFAIPVNEAQPSSCFAWNDDSALHCNSAMADKSTHLQLRRRGGKEPRHTRHQLRKSLITSQNEVAALKGRTCESAAVARAVLRAAGRICSRWPRSCRRWLHHTQSEARCRRTSRCEGNAHMGRCAR